MLVVVTVVVAFVAVALVAVVVAAVARCRHLVAELLHCSCKSLLRCLGRVELDVDCSLLERDLEVLHSLLESEVLVYFLYAVLAVEIYSPGHFLEFGLRLLASLLICCRICCKC